jgi:methylornithine synthase
MNTTEQKLESILIEAKKGAPLTDGDVEFLAGLTDPDHCRALFAAARLLRRGFFGDKVFLYGFLYISTFCRNDCRFCFFRRSNIISRRYRKEATEILSAALRLADSGIHLVDLTMGEDPDVFAQGEAGFDRLVELVISIRRATGLQVMVSPGVVPQTVLNRLGQAGAAWYACYQETHRRGLFNELRPGQDYDNRLDAKRNAHRQGLLIEEGLLCGVGETPADIATSVRMMQDLDADQIRVMRFVPQPGTPMGDRTPPDSESEMKIISVLRLVFPDRLIPASLDVEGLDGLKRRLDAGANVITSIVPSGNALAGVASHDLDIEEGRRSVDFVKKVLDTCGLRIAGAQDYTAWIDNRRRAITGSQLQREKACGLR